LVIIIWGCGGVGGGGGRFGVDVGGEGGRVPEKGGGEWQGVEGEDVP
jgi:hypothetical protein